VFGFGFRDSLLFALAIGKVIRTVGLISTLLFDIGLCLFGKGYHSLLSSGQVLDSATVVELVPPLMHLLVV
jgi:hypothetical protein